MLLKPALRIKGYDDDDDDGDNEDRLEREGKGSSDLEVEYGDVLDIAQMDPSLLRGATMRCRQRKRTFW